MSQLTLDEDGLIDFLAILFGYAISGERTLRRSTSDSSDQCQDCIDHICQPCRWACASLPRNVPMLGFHEQSGWLATHAEPRRVK